jgi:hypothetical protein
MSVVEDNKYGSMGDVMVFGPPIYPRDASEYPVLVGCNENMAIVATNRKTGYLMTRVVHGENVTIAKSDLEDIEVLQKKYPIAAGPWIWALDAIGKPVPEDW